MKLESLKKPCVIYHAECTDGFGAAYAARKVYGDDAIYIPGYFERGIPKEVDGMDVVILDFSFRKKEYYELLDRAASVHLIDHHASAMKDLAGAPGTFFDMSKSGAMLAWEAFIGGEPPQLIRHIQDIDLWRFELTGTQHVFYGLEALPMTFESWAPYLDGPQANDNLKSLISDGRAIEKWIHKQVDIMAGKAAPIHLMGFDGLAVNAPAAFVNELGASLAKQSGSFALVWHEAAGGVKCSLRSVRDFDCSEIAVAMGGGGHKNASAFRLGSEKLNPGQTIQTLVEGRGGLGL